MIATDRVVAHLDDLSEIAWAHEPDWNAVYEGAGHSWCHDVSVAAADLLRDRGIPARVITGGLRGNHHTWLALADGTILDLTIAQYIDRTEDRCVSDDEVPWTMTERDEELVAVIEPSHPFHREYHSGPAG